MSMNRGPSSASSPSSEPLSASALRGAVDLSALAESARHAGAKTTDPSSMPYVIDVNDQSFEQFMQLSASVIVIAGVYADQVPGSQAIIDDLGSKIAAYKGRIAVGRIKGENSQGILQAFQLQALPAAIALIKGQPVPIFQGNVPHDWESIFSQLIQLGDEHGVTGSLPQQEEGASAQEESTLSPDEEEALDALEKKDFSAAAAAYQRILDREPADVDAKKGLLNVELLERLEKIDSSVRERAASDADDLQAHLDVSDMDFFAGHTQDALTRLIRFISAHPGQEREPARTRVLEFFELLGAEDEAVAAARRQLAAALF